MTLATAGQEMRVPGRLVRDRTALMLALAVLAGAVALLSLGTGRRACPPCASCPR